MAKQYYFNSILDGRIIKTANPSHYQNAEFLALPEKEGIALYEEQCKQVLRDKLPKASTVYTILRGVSSSGMSRQIQCVIVNNGQIDDITRFASQVTGYAQNKDGYLSVGGCGMNMGFAVVYGLAMSIYGDGYALKHEWL